MSFKESLALCLITLLTTTIAGAQRIDNLSYSQRMDSVSHKLKTYITYDLEAPYQNIPCQVKVFLTSGVMSFYIKQVTGDVGDQIYPGEKKSIVWDHIEELVHFSGEVNLRVDMNPSVQIIDKTKRNRQVTVTLAPIYTANKTYAIKLYQAGKEVARLNDVLLIERTFPITIPKRTRIRGKYQVAITDGEKIFFSNSFKVRRKISYGWLAVPVVGAAAYLIISQQKEDNEPLPLPPSIN